MQIHRDFISRATVVAKNDAKCLGLAAGGSWIGRKCDEFSDVDLLYVSSEKVSNDSERMKNLASKFGTMINAFTGEHIGDRRVLICIFDEPLLHVDIKFLTLEEFKHRVEDPEILFEKDGALSKVIAENKSKWPELDLQWIEDRFWTWIHYGALKIGRGEYFETLDFLSFLRSTVLAPLMQLKNDCLPRGLRRVEQNFSKEDLTKLEETIADNELESLLKGMQKAIDLYRELRLAVFDENVALRSKTEEKCVKFFDEIRKQKIGQIPSKVE